MMTSDSRLFRSVLEAVTQILKESEGAHDLDHTLRVLNNAALLAEEENLSARDRQILFLSCLLHDCARPEEFHSGGKVCHALLGGPKAEKILRENSCTDEDLICRVSHAVTRHRYRGKEQPVTLTDKLLYDADKLDSIGAVGIGRAFHFAGRIGARVHNTEEEALASEAYTREDSAYREYLVKLRHVAGRMLTGSGKRLAAQRSAFMEEFFRELKAETSFGNGLFPEK